LTKSPNFTTTPHIAVPGARVTLHAPNLVLPIEGLPHVLVGDKDARVVAASPRRVTIVIPADADPGEQIVRIEEMPGVTGRVIVGAVFVTDVHQVDSPVFDRDGRLYVTRSGSRDAKPQVPLYRVAADGGKTPLQIEIGNPTSLAFGLDGWLYVSSRFDGNVYRIQIEGNSGTANGEPGTWNVERYATELGVATGLAFSPSGDLYVGDRSGTIFRVRPDRQVETFATLPASVAAFHLAVGPDDCLYVAAPTLATHDAIYRISPERLVDVVTDKFGRPQGIAFDGNGEFYVVDALAGSAGLYRLDVASDAAEPELVIAAPTLVGVAFSGHTTVLASNDTIWKLDGMLSASHPMTKTTPEKS
jgi:sugar lactone lactonase YvrE